MTTTPEDLPDDIAALQAALVSERAKRIEEAARAARVEAELAVAKAKASNDEALIAHQQLQIAKLTRQLYGQHSERTVQLLDQMELSLEELESSATEDEIAAERAVAKTTNVVAFTRKRPARHLYLARARDRGAGHAVSAWRRGREKRTEEERPGPRAPPGWSSATPGTRSSARSSTRASPRSSSAATSRCSEPPT